MTTAEFAAELYRNFDWRFDEVRRLDLLIRRQEPEAFRDELRKPLVVFLYSHFEGFCIFALEHYLTAVNAARLTCSAAVPAVLAGAWERMFNAMQHGDEKCEVFRAPLPRDEGLHRHWRRRHFIEEMDRLLQLPVRVPEETLDAESNLKPHVLRRNLFVLGLNRRLRFSNPQSLR